MDEWLFWEQYSHEPYASAIDVVKRPAVRKTVAPLSTAHRFVGPIAKPDVLLVSTTARAA
jgi:hypothetical protein